MNKSLEQILEEQRTARKDQAQQFTDRKEDWLHRLVALYDQIESWLRHLQDKGYIQFKREGIPISEELLGSYLAPSLVIEIDDRFKIQLLPVGLHVIGANGRVDVMMNVLGRDIKVVGKSDSGDWEFAERKEGKYRRFPFTRENLEQIIADAVSAS